MNIKNIEEKLQKRLDALIDEYYLNTDKDKVDLKEISDMISYFISEYEKKYYSIFKGFKIIVKHNSDKFIATIEER